MSHNTEKIDYLLPMWTLTIRLEIYKTYVEKINILCKVTVGLFQRKSSLNHLYGNWWLVDQTNEQSEIDVDPVKLVELFNLMER